MPVNANTVETYDNVLIREDLREQYYIISPEECPFQQAVGTGQDCTQALHEWPILALADVDDDNAVIEGEDDPGIDEGTLANRRSNVCQISDKVVSVSHTSEAIDAAAYDVQKLTKQMAIKLRELKRDMESILLLNRAANLGASGTARATAGFPNFLRTNVTVGATGAVASLSDDPNGYPNGTVDPGTNFGFAEADLNDSMQTTWEAGGNPTILMTNANNKRIISENFTGSSTMYKDRVDRSLVNAVDIYTSDFGEVTVVPNRFQPSLDKVAGSADPGTSFAIYGIDPDYAEVCFLDNVKNKELAETGHSYKRLIWGEYCLAVLNEAAHFMIGGLDGTYAAP
jgi:hypothetical protein